MRATIRRKCKSAEASITAMVLFYFPILHFSRCASVSKRRKLFHELLIFKCLSLNLISVFFLCMCSSILDTMLKLEIKGIRTKQKTKALRVVKHETASKRLLCSFLGRRGFHFSMVMTTDLCKWMNIDICSFTCRRTSKPCRSTYIREMEGPQPAHRSSRPVRPPPIPSSH